VPVLLSFAYALLAKDCFSAVLTVGFDPYQGFFHAGRHGRPSLALDLMEEFRAVIADSVVLTLINNGMVSPRDFLTWNDACQLTETGRRQFFRAYEQRQATIVKHPVFGYPMTVLFIPLCDRCADQMEALGRPVEKFDARDIVIVT
jgi:CRISP-associated protein Cas1